MRLPGIPVLVKQVFATLTCVALLSCCAPRTAVEFSISADDHGSSGDAGAEINPDG
jgi:hypothetical protein